MMSVADFFYGAREPLMIIRTPQSSTKSHLYAASPQTPNSVDSSRDRIHNSHNTVMELKVPVCCEGCEERLKHSLLKCSGVESVQCDSYKQRVMVTGSAAPAEVLKICKKLHRRSELVSSAIKTVRGSSTPAALHTPVGNWTTWSADWTGRNTPAAISAWQ